MHESSLPIFTAIHLQEIFLQNISKLPLHESIPRCEGKSFDALAKLILFSHPFQKIKFSKEGRLKVKTHFAQMCLQRFGQSWGVWEGGEPRLVDH